MLTAADFVQRCSTELVVVVYFIIIIFLVYISSLTHTKNDIAQQISLCIYQYQNFK